MKSTLKSTCKPSEDWVQRKQLCHPVLRVHLSGMDAGFEWECRDLEPG